MTPRDLIDRIVVGEMRKDAAALEAQILKGCSRCGAALVSDGQPIDPEGTAITSREDVIERRREYEVLCRKCSHFDEAIDPFGLQPVMARAFYVFPRVKPEDEATIKEAVRKMNQRTIVPHEKEPELTVDAIREALADWGSTRLKFAALIHDLPLTELRAFRDRLNEIIYDKERGSP